jgi:uncharacterized membrane protein YdjX (TVP38/TMEM64 family)
MNKFRKLTRLELKFLFWSIVFALVVTGLSAWISPYFDLSRSSFIREIVEAKPWALSFYFLYSAFASVFVPVPTMPLEILFAGFFGIPLTLAVRLAGSLAGAAFAFFLAHRYGRPFLKRLLPVSTYQEVEKFSHMHGLKTFFLISVFPLVNPEVMAFVAGLGNLRLFPVLGILLIANFYRFFLAMMWGKQILENLGL